MNKIVTEPIHEESELDPVIAKVVQMRREDHGVGPYEYAGSSGFHHQHMWVPITASVYVDITPMWKSASPEEQEAGVAIFGKNILPPRVRCRTVVITVSRGFEQEHDVEFEAEIEGESFWQDGKLLQRYDTI